VKRVGKKKKAALKGPGTKRISPHVLAERGGPKREPGLTGRREPLPFDGTKSGILNRKAG